MRAGEYERDRLAHSVRDLADMIEAVKASNAAQVWSAGLVRYTPVIAA